MQIDLIFKLLGTPNEESWPGVTSLRDWNKLIKNEYDNRLRTFVQSKMPDADEVTLSFIEGLLSLNPKERFTTEEALAHPYFTSDPLPCTPA